MPSPFAFLLVLAAFSSSAQAESVARVGNRVVTQEDIDKAFGSDALAKDDLRSLAVFSVAVAQSVSGATGDPDAVADVSVKDAVEFVRGLDAMATKAAVERLTDSDYGTAYAARRTYPGDPKANVPWVAASPEDREAFEAGFAARMGFRMACATIEAALPTTPIVWLVPKPTSWPTWSSPRNCAAGG